MEIETKNPTTSPSKWGGGGRGGRTSNDSHYGIIYPLGDEVVEGGRRNRDSPCASSVESRGDRFSPFPSLSSAILWNGNDRLDVPHVQHRRNRSNVRGSSLEFLYIYTRKSIILTEVGDQEERKRDRSNSFRGYSRTNMLLNRVAGRQNTMTRTSATARFTMKKFVTVLIRGDLYTTAITKLFPIRPTTKTRT